jgi:phosphoserine phosphatase
LKLTQGLGGSSKEHSDIFREFTSGNLSYPEAKSKLLVLWQENRQCQQSLYGKDVPIMETQTGCKDTIEYLKKNYQLCLISGAVDLYVEVVADKLGVVDWFANTELVWDKKESLIDFHYHADQAATKVEHFNEFISRKSLNRDKCAIVGDGDIDLVVHFTTKKLNLSTLTQQLLLRAQTQNGVIIMGVDAVSIVK